MGPKSIQLSTSLSQIIRMLDQDGQSHWSDVMSLARDDLLASDYFGVKTVLAAYDGEDSFNNVSISNPSKKNEKFAELRTEILWLSKEIEKKYQESK